VGKAAATVSAARRIEQIATTAQDALLYGLASRLPWRRRDARTQWKAWQDVRMATRELLAPGSTAAGETVSRARAARRTAGERLAACPCGEPTDPGATPCTPDRPCGYAEAMERDRWPERCHFTLVTPLADGDFAPERRCHLRADHGGEHEFGLAYAPLGAREVPGG
jgi:hypothetical protein